MKDYDMAKKSSQTLNVLIVEDEPPIALVQRKAIEFAGHAVTVAENGADALEILLKGGIGIVLLDYQLPDTNEGDLLKTIVEQYPDVPVIIITGHGDERLVAEVMKAGAKDYIVKDYESNYLKILPKIIASIHRQSHLEIEARQLREKVAEREKLFQSILDNTTALICLKDTNGKYILINKIYEELFHINRYEIKGKTEHDIFPKEIADTFQANDQKVLETRAPLKIEEVAPHDDGPHTYISIKFPLFDLNGVPYGVCGISTDITDRKQADEQIKKSLKEKELLLQEIYHRTKNNMQVICSLLHLQSQYTNDEQVLKIFGETENRIESMSLVHAKLYQSKDLSSINLKDYIEELANNLFRAYYVNTDKISLKFTNDNIFINIDSAIPCGLLINEIITNSLKYAFPDSRKGEIRTVLCKTDNGEIELRIADNGIGMPKGLDFRNTKTLGLRLVTNLVEYQLKGKIDITSENGVVYRITFKETNRPKRI